jgi:arsenate reductase
MLKIYHNPRCKKSRAGLEFIKNKGIEVEIIEYLKNPISEDILKLLLAKLHLNPQQIIRTQEDIYKKQFKGKNFNDDEWIKIMVEYPNLIQRPIVEKKNSAIIGDPVDNLETFL